MVLIKATPESESGTVSEGAEELHTAMGHFNEELLNAGVLVNMEGLHPSSKGARVRFSGKKRTVIDGPFAETKELLAGYWIWNVASREEAIEWLKRCPNPMTGESDIELRQVFEAEDFGDEFTPEARAQEDRLRIELAKQQSKVAPVAPMIFVNLPVHDLGRSIEFFTKLGYTFNPQFTDEQSTCMVISDTIYFMLLTEERFKGFTPKPIADAKSSTEALMSLALGSRQAVTAIVETALAAGAGHYKGPEDVGFMYSWGFEDLDGHIWEYFWMDPAHVEE
jgi:predicted lactoylglutathione lyase